MGISDKGLQFRQGYLADRMAFVALADLLQEVFDIDITALDRLGGPDSASMPFGYFDAEGRCVANFTAFPMPLMLEGRLVSAVGYQSGAVRPEFRGQGLYRDLMRRAFAWSDEQGFALGLLLTDKPGLYHSHGFRSVDQAVFAGVAPRRSKSETSPVALSLDKREDVARIRALLAVRTPVSDTFAVARQTEMFLLNAYFDPMINLAYLPGLDAVVASKQDGAGMLHLLDIVAREIPSLSDILGTFDMATDRVVVHFPPDRLGWDGYAAQPADWPCDLMLRAPGFQPLPTAPLSLSPMAEF